MLSVLHKKRLSVDSTNKPTPASPLVSSPGGALASSSASRVNGEAAGLATTAGGKGAGQAGARRTEDHTTGASSSMSHPPVRPAPTRATSPPQLPPALPEIGRDYRLNSASADADLARALAASMTTAPAAQPRVAQSAREASSAPRANDAVFACSTADLDEHGASSLGLEEDRKGKFKKRLSRALGGVTSSPSCAFFS